MSADLERLSGGALGWLGRHLEYFDPYSVPAGSSEHGKAKAALELGLLRHCWARPGAGDARHAARLGEATALVSALWQHPDFPRLITAEPRYAANYGLVYAALAPDGIDDTPCRAALARLTDDDLSPHGKSAYQRLELRYYADKAGVPHTIESYAELAEQNVLVTLSAAPAKAPRDRAGSDQAGSDPAGPDDAPPATIPEAYAVTHSSFYLSDFGRTAPALSDEALSGAAELVGRLLEYSIRRDWWDLVAELLMTQACLGGAPLRTPAGAAAVGCLLRAQRADGAIPGRSPATSATAAEPAGAFFANAYHTTLVTALMSLLVASARAL